MKSGGKTFDNLSRSMLSAGMLLAIAIFPVLVQADDWPQWRGLRRDAVSTETGLMQQGRPFQAR